MIPIKHLSIKDKKLWKLVDKAYWEYHKKLAIIPASMTGNNHPPKDREVGGMLNHINNMCWFIKRYQEQFQFPDDIIDEMMVAAFFHDLGELESMTFTKEVIVTDSKSIRRETHITRDDEKAYNHPMYSIKILDDLSKDIKIPNDQLDRIRNMIGKHMSHWYEKGELPTSMEEIVFSLADMIVSRNEFRLEEDERENP